MAFVTTSYANQIGMGLGAVTKTVGAPTAKTPATVLATMKGSVAPTKTVAPPVEAAPVAYEAPAEFTAEVAVAPAEDPNKKMLLYAGGGLAVLAVIYFMTR